MSGSPIQHHILDGNAPAVLYLPGYRSNMNGIKALALEEHCRNCGRAYGRFDYRGHGSSDQDFCQFTLSDWIEDTLWMVDQINMPVILVGSSMGAWIALHVARLRPQNISGIVGLAPAVDFTEDWYQSLTAKQRTQLHEDGVLFQNSFYDSEPYPYTRKLIEDAREWLLLKGSTTISIDKEIPVHLIHGQSDQNVGWNKSLEIADRIGHDNVVLILVKNGNHRLSDPNDIKKMVAAVDSMS